MSKTHDIRWILRFDNFQRALARLRQGVGLVNQRQLSDLEQLGLIHIFEFTHELAWNVLKDFLIWQGVADIIGSRDATRTAFKVGLLDDGAVWMAMIKSRNLSSHTYREEVADDIAGKIVGNYYDAFCELEKVMLARKDDVDEA
ncbi:nucleotidyltransferase [Endozoicomonas montiporae]|uniref:Nucleotidyltransferase n=2 Tax=Endozoicomonas montiporae TaxID=1027273 RepID=A0A081NC81_9GAMM|nr:nucleotidyltransferase substrate binding protein [Endozoicomonas montiporae]AMO56386.1 nucleotidyltransferase substrate binding protein [Endozoicomonas montiporae CL-33]KEQ16054.1 nucleotidyltransferase [Endozoicomonas montiporae]